MALVSINAYSQEAECDWNGEEIKEIVKQSLTETRCNQLKEFEEIEKR